MSEPARPAFQPSFTALLLSLLALFALAPPLASTPAGTPVALAAYWVLLGSGSLVASREPARRRAMLALAALALALDAAAILKGEAGTLALLARSAECAFLAALIVALLGRVIRSGRVSTDVMMGGVCIYLLLGLLFMDLFTLVELVEPGSFLLAGRPISELDVRVAGRFPGLIYFSFVTLTTLGYGDIVPVSPAARALAPLEAVVGQLYVAILIAGLVGQRLAERAGHDG